MLQIDYDIADALVTDPGLALIDPAASFRLPVQSGGVNCPYFVTPSGTALVLRPAQLLTGWPSMVKFRAADYSSPVGWEEQQIRANGDWWMHSVQPVTPLSLRYGFPPNTGWFVEFRAYAEPKTIPSPIFDFAFGGWFRLLLYSDGTVELYDIRRSQTSPAASGNIANGKSFLNQDVQLMVMPFRHGKLLIWSPNLGGSLEIKTKLSTAGTVTDSSAPSAYVTVVPPMALIAITPLLYPADSIAAIDAPAIPLVQPLTQTPSFGNSLFDSGGESVCMLQALTPYSTGATITSFSYSVTMAGNTAHQTAEQQGVIGIGPSTGIATGDAFFGGGAYPWSLISPALFMVAVGYGRTLGTKEYTRNTIMGALSANLRLSKDRAAKQFTFVLDNPANTTGVGANYTSLKDLQNRRCRAYLTNPSLESGQSPTAVAADPDPDTPLIVAYGCKRVYLFDGFGDQPEFVDGAASRLRIRCQGLRKRLRSYVFFDQPIYDGQLHTTVVTDILMRCGFVGPTDTEPTGLNLEILCAPSADKLPSGMPGNEPLFTPSLGSTAEEFIELIQRYTGWILDDLIPVGATSSCWYWAPSSYFADSVYAALGTPIVSESSKFHSGLSVSGLPIPDAVKPNAGLGSLVTLSNPPPRQSLEELIANEIFVIGVRDNGKIVIAHARDTGSISDRTAVNYIGEVRSYVFVCQSINTQELANQVCAILYSNLSQARTHLTFALPDYYPQLGIGAPLSIMGYWNGVIDGVEAGLGSLNVHKTVITVTRTD